MERLRPLTASTIPRRKNRGPKYNATSGIAVVMTTVNGIVMESDSSVMNTAADGALWWWWWKSTTPMSVAPNANWSVKTARRYVARFILSAGSARSGRVTRMTATRIACSDEGVGDGQESGQESGQLGVSWGSVGNRVRNRVRSGIVGQETGQESG